MKLSIITLTYNQLKYTKKFVDSLYKYTKDFELIIVDNGSTDGTVEYLYLLERENLKLILNQENLGFSKGNNQGIEIASGEYVGFLNNDILLYPNWFEECEKVFKNEKAAFVAPRHVNPYYDNTNDKSYLKYFKNLKFQKPYEKNFDDCVFSCVLTKKEIIDKIGLFDENYSPAFFEDNDYKYRAIENGYDVFVCNTACFFHYGSITSVFLNQNFEDNKNYYYSKYRFGEYLSINGELNNKLRHQINIYNKLHLSVFYKIQNLVDKIKLRIKRAMFKYLH